jgi:glycosyltransferase involved in cell wall biosynthesis
MEDMSDLVSIVIPTFNRAKILPRAIECVMAQAYQNFEIVIVDDASSDETPRLFEGVGDSRIRFLRLAENVGGAEARNVGWRSARGGFVAFLDSDDAWLPDKLAKQLQAIHEAGRKTGLVYTGLLYCDAAGTVTDRRLDARRGDLADDILATNFVGSLSSVLVRRSCLEQISGLDSTLKSCQDWDLYIRLARVCQFECVPEYLVRYLVDKSDVNRISNRSRSIVTGHKAIRRKYRRQYGDLPTEKKIQHLEFLRAAHATAADSSSVVVLSWQVFRLDPSFSQFVSSLRVLARSIKRRIGASRGY